MTRRKAESQQALRADEERRREETVCGSVAGWLRHLHDKTEPCDPCRLEWSAFSSTSPKYARPGQAHTEGKPA